MSDVQKFEVNGRMAISILNFELYDNLYCIYALKDDNDLYDVCYGKIVNNFLVPCNPEEGELVSQIAKKYVSIFKGRVK